MENRAKIDQKAHGKYDEKKKKATIRKIENKILPGCDPKNDIISVGSLKIIEEKFKINHIINGTNKAPLIFKNIHFFVALIILKKIFSN